MTRGQKRRPLFEEEGFDDEAYRNSDLLYEKDMQFIQFNLDARISLTLAFLLTF